MIAGVSKSGLGSTTFLPLIHLQLPRTLSPKPLFQLWPAFRKLTFEQLLIPQSGGIVDIMILTMFLRSTAPIYISFLPSFLCPGVILSLIDQVTCGPPNQRTRSISPFELREFQFSNFTYSRSISPGVHDPTTCFPFGSTTAISSGIHDFQPFKSPKYNIAEKIGRFTFISLN
jgi:hypothetical protein